MSWPWKICPGLLVTLLLFACRPWSETALPTRVTPADLPDGAVAERPPQEGGRETAVERAPSSPTAAPTSPIAPTQTAFASPTSIYAETGGALAATAPAPDVAEEPSATWAPEGQPQPTNTLASTSTPEPTSTQPPTPTDTSEPASVDYAIIPPTPPVGAADPNTYITTLRIPTYNYEQAFISTTENDPIYPYPHLDFERVGPPSPRTYNAIVLENGFCSLTILPELGGRIYRWVDKATGLKLLYENPVVKPTSWGYRGWWLAAGGIEWAFPVEEHGFLEYQPWQYAINGGSVTVSTVEQQTGLEVGATISLSAGQAYVTIQPWARNNTTEPQRFQLWVNAMLSLGGNAVAPQTQFIVPSNQVIIHSAGVSGVPGAGATMSWPDGSGRDLSWYGAWDGHLGFFIPNISFVGIYDHVADQGVVRVKAPGWPAGTKIFGPATISPATWTDDNSNYIELWSGATNSFWSYATLAPGESVGWTERWYPISHIGGFSYANEAAALRLDETGGGAEIGVSVSGGTTGVIHLYVGLQEVANWPVSLYPGQAFRASWSRPANLAGALGLRFTDNQGNIVAQTGQVP